MNPSELKIGECLDVHNIDLVRPHTYKHWLIVAEATVFLSDSAAGEEERIGKIPIDEISPYEDFDPATLRRSWEIRLKMCQALLQNANRHLCVVAYDETHGELILSLKRALLDERTVSHLQHELPYRVEGFRSLDNVHHHLLKHPLGLGRDAADWPQLLNIRYWREGILQRLQNADCPAASAYDGETKVLDTNACQPCPVEQKMRCFPLLSALRNAYEHQTLACVAEASNPSYPRHYHAREERRGQKRPTLVFMDQHGRKVVAKGEPGADYTTATFYQPNPAEAAVADESQRYQSERRRIRAQAGRKDWSMEKICTPLGWGYR